MDNDLNNYAAYLQKYNGVSPELLPFVEYNQRVEGEDLYTPPTSPTLPEFTLPSTIKIDNPLVIPTITTTPTVAPTAPTPVTNTYNTPASRGQTASSKEVINFFVNKGLPKHVAAGIAGNLMVESGFKTTPLGDNATSFGMAQWRDPTPGKGRWTNLKNFTKTKGLDVNSTTGQLEYLWHELNNDYRGVLSKIKIAKTPEDAAEIFRKHFERPAPDARMEAQRRGYARKFYLS